jgi:hypothetical protein
MVPQVACTDEAATAKFVKETMVEAASVCMVETSKPRLMQMLPQRVETPSGNEFIAFWDSGSQVTMLTHRRAAAAGLQPEEAAPLNMKGFRSEGVVLDKGYHIPLRTKDGGTCTLGFWGC